MSADAMTTAVCVVAIVWILAMYTDVFDRRKR